MSDRLFMNEMSWTTYQKRIEGGALILLPVGATEQHGPHLPMGTDVMLATAVAVDVAKQLDAIVAPAVAFGYKSQPKMGGGNHYCGTTSLDADTLAHVLRDVIKEFARHGARRLVLINGHYENMMFSIEGIDLAMRELSYMGIRDFEVLRLEYWDFTRTETIEKIFPDGFPGFALEHAAVMETSLMLYHHPELVDMAALPTDKPADFPAYDVYPTRTGWVPCSGVLSPATGCAAEKGKLLAADYAIGVTDAIRKEFPNVKTKTQVMA
ncbi:creatininase [Hyphomicrobium sp.]|uniref:creatininase n=1 Tax=Hyphomicrobium sp. TaxID=82 RepID=UPI001D6CAAB0|nr:creatininase [Hyphomicrobium sp.]MBY0559633.1 creatininase [Hyphomicrobium sp.]